MVAPRIELGATRLSAAFGRPALDYLILFSVAIPMLTDSGVLSVRTGSAVVWEAFESSSTGFQPVALPLELPNRIHWYWPAFWPAAYTA